MDVRKIRAELRQGRSLFDLPLRVTFYARVSTDKEEQLNSLENQVQYYTELIQAKPNWRFVDGYIDEGLSGTSTRKRDSFKRMISDAKAGRFDFIITKEISRFSRSTLDSIKYTQELLEHDVGVLFQNDNINTLDPDSEFRLVVMAGVAQDEMRKLSERLKFGFRQAIRNGHVLGNSSLWGYDKKDCVLTVNEAEAEVVRLIFTLYANQGLGIRRISRQLSDRGYTSRKGNAFNVPTIRNILLNPKYKGWYCGNKTQSADYRSKKKVVLDESEWVTYPDPAIPAIVPEVLWDRANALYKARSARLLSQQSAAEFHNRYPYSGKIICEAHDASFHRRLLAGKRETKEIWECRVYRQRGRAGCGAPNLRTAELDAVMARIFKELIQDKQVIINALVGLIQAVPGGHDYGRDLARIGTEITQIRAKKDRLLELSIAGAVSVGEFKSRNECFNGQIALAEQKLSAVRQEQEKAAAGNTARIKAALGQELDFAKGVDSELAAAILERAVVKKDSSREEVHLRIHLKSGVAYEAALAREKSSFRFSRFCRYEQPDADYVR